MGFRIFLWIAAGTTLVLGGEPGGTRLTGNLRWDLVQAMNDTVVSEVSVVVQQPAKQNAMLNGLYSLIIPGAGQYQTDHYVKAGVFVAAEIAFAAFAVISNRNGDKKTEDFQRYAEAHWSPVRYAQWINTYGAADYGPAASINLARVGQFDFTEINEWERGQHKLGFSHTLPKFREQQYYELIGKYNQFKFGWDEYPRDVNGVPISDGMRYDDLIPQQLLNYAVERGKANDDYYAASFAMKALLLNHILSAFDAMLSTASYNHSLTTSFKVTPVESIYGQRLMSEMKVSVGL
jgi:hypothetical protein